MRGAVALAVVLVTAGLAGCVGDDSDTPAIGETPQAEQAPADDVDRHIVVDIVAVKCPEGYDNNHDDDVCLAYDGRIPGPTWVFEKDQHVTIELRHRVGESLAELDVDVNESTAEKLSEGRYSMHRHGLSLSACNDGVAKINGTEICDSTVGPGETVTYEFNTSFPGEWHYHDHGLSFNGEPANASILGPEAEDRGLFGSFKVLEENETIENVFDLHVLDTGVNGGMGLNETVDAGESFELLAAGLGMRSALDTVRLENPDGQLVDEVLIGPGASRGITVDSAQPGTYTWTSTTQGNNPPGPSTATNPQYQYQHEGTITVNSSGPSSQAQAHEHTHEERPSTLAHRSIEDDTRVRPADWEQADRRFVIDFTFTSADTRSQANAATGGPPSGLPLLEAYAGEKLAFEVVNGEGPFQHVFHLHGHPWKHPETGEMIDAEPMPAGDTHSFTVTAGLGEGHTGDWYYHCHIGLDVGPMWSVLRVYENSMDAQGPLEDLTVTVEDADGDPIQDATLIARWNPNAPADPTLAQADDGRQIPVQVTETAPGVYDVEADVPEGVAGELVIESEHETGNSVVRLTVSPDGSYELNRDVGVDASDGLAPPATEPVEDVSPIEGVR